MSTTTHSTMEIPENVGPCSVLGHVVCWAENVGLWEKKLEWLNIIGQEGKRGILGWVIAFGPNFSCRKIIFNKTHYIRRKNVNTLHTLET